MSRRSADRVRLLAQRLGLVNERIRCADRSLADLLGNLTASEEPAAGQLAEQRDAEILASLPGVGRTVLATLLAEASGPLHARDYQALRCLCRVAPVTKHSGKARRGLHWRASQPRLVNAVYHWSRGAVQHDPVSGAKYCALRTVADRLLAVSCAMLHEGELFDPARAAARPRTPESGPDPSSMTHERTSPPAPFLE